MADLEQPTEKSYVITMFEAILASVRKVEEQGEQCRVRCNQEMTKIWQRVDQQGDILNRLAGADEERKERKGLLVKIAPHWAHVVVALTLAGATFFIGRALH